MYPKKYSVDEALLTDIDDLDLYSREKIEKKVEEDDLNPADAAVLLGFIEDDCQEES